MVEIREKFWGFETVEMRPDIVPPLLAFADLLATGEPRNVEAAGMIYDKYLQGKGLWGEDVEAQIKEEAEETISQAIKEAEGIPDPKPEEFFQYAFAEMTPNLKEQMADFLAFLGEKGD